jgi:hypothetical protein
VPDPLSVDRLPDEVPVPKSRAEFADPVPTSPTDDAGPLLSKLRSPDDPADRLAFAAPVPPVCPDVPRSVARPRFVSYVPLPRPAPDRSIVPASDR